MNLQEREIELKYLNKIIKRVEQKTEAMYYLSPAHEYDNYAWEKTATGGYDYEYEQILEQRSIKWRETDEAKEYERQVGKLGKMLSLRATLEGAQENYIIDKYKL